MNSTKSWTKPTAEQVEHAVALLTKREHYRYFFDKLENPEWVEPLHDHGLFANATPPDYNEEGQTVSFPPWPASRYLARMAPHVPDVVGRIALTIETDNASVQSDLVEAACHFSPEVAAEIATKVGRWLDVPYSIPFFDERVADFAVALVDKGKIQEAKRLIRKLLAVRRPQVSETAAHMLREPLARIDLWHYERYLRRFVETVSSHRESALALLETCLSLLEQSVRVSLEERPNREHAGSVEDYSYLWRPAIEEHGQNEPTDLRDSLVVAVRDLSTVLIAEHGEDLRQIVGLVESNGFAINRRIALHLVRVFAYRDSDLVKEKLVSRASFDDASIHHEYYLLSESCFGSLAAEAQREVLNWIDAGPQIDIAGASVDRDEEIDRWRFRRLLPLASTLEADWQERFEILSSRFSPSDHPDFLTYSTGVYSRGEVSPRSQAEIAAMDISSLVDFLKNWKPDAQPLSFDGPSREGLGDQLAALFKKNAAVYSDAADRFWGVHPTYLSRILGALRDAINDGVAISWTPVLELMQRVVQDQGDDDTDRWRWARRSVINLVEAGISEDRIPIEHADAVWDVLSPLTDDLDPTPESEGTNEQMDALTVSINTVRGDAVNAVVQYALWVRRATESGNGGTERLAQGFAALPAVRDTLDRHLDPAVDPSRAVRAVYGRWLPWLTLFDRDWVTAKLPGIFPESPEASGLFYAAWETYLTYTQPYSGMIEILEGQYRRAVVSLEATQELRERDQQRAALKLGEHLITYYWRGDVDLAEDGLVREFFRRASPLARAHVMEFVGRGLRNTEDTIPPDIVQRLVALWEWRMAVIEEPAQDIDFTGEIESFEWWFSSGQLDPQWSLEQLERVVSLGGAPHPYLSFTVERLAELAEDFPEETVRCLRLLIESKSNRMGVRAWADPARAVLSSALRQPGEAQAIAKAILETLGRLGEGDLFRDLAQ